MLSRGRIQRGRVTGGPLQVRVEAPSVQRAIKSWPRAVRGVQSSVSAAE